MPFGLVLDERYTVSFVSMGYKEIWFAWHPWNVRKILGQFCDVVPIGRAPPNQMIPTCR